MKHSVWVPMARRIASPGTVRFSRRTTKMKRYPVLRAIKNEIKCAPLSAVSALLTSYLEKKS